MKELGQEEPKALLEKGFADLKEGHFEDAIQIFSRYYSLYPLDDRPLRGRGLARLQLNEASLAQKDFEEARKINNGDPENSAGLGLSLAMQNKIYEAIGVYESLLQTHPDFVQGYIQLGLLQFKLGAISKGKEYFSQALLHRPTLSQRRLLESTLKEQGKLDKNRYYRPDFDKLSKQQSRSWLAEVVGSFLRFLRLKV